ncbi:hypothetical protein N7454_001863 [Penicillium verhagenii]|nr:hypothetical protein N7454_001863 [Penicillium verhagenii]
MEGNTLKDLKFSLFYVMERGNKRWVGWSAIIVLARLYQVYGGNTHLLLMIEDFQTLPAGPVESLVETSTPETPLRYTLVPDARDEEAISAVSAGPGAPTAPAALDTEIGAGPKTRT